MSQLTRSVAPLAEHCRDTRKRGPSLGAASSELTRAFSPWACPQPIFMYINSSGTTSADGRSVGFETEAFAIADCMKYIRPPVHTICLGQAYGSAAMLLAQGSKGNRACLPNASIMLHQPRSMARGQATDIAIRAREVIANRKVTCSLIASACGKDLQTVLDDASRTKYLTPQEAVEYGMIDKVLKSETDLPAKPSFMSAL